ncbi:hypothetical protein QBC32DRAFT_374842 [Pseudoneurospora amorphoporcata]|uniref:Uncharacterized protein n=1 Tax=Pseudoneurospora amorphoporcata TaxID=241081 RepID=A0AAN6SAI4_9PEZI|nr:hypothetical protein QBC32DRAFT_374842 [Pseudoneurospora amorphoporcata]
MLWERDINDNKLTVVQLLEQLSTISNTEKRQNNLTVQVKTSSNNKTDNKNSNTNTASTSSSNKTNTNNNSGGNRKSVCTVCNNAISKDHIHYVYGRHCNTRKHAKLSSNTSTMAALGNINTTLANLATTGSTLLFNRRSNFNMASFSGGNLGFH